MDKEGEEEEGHSEDVTGPIDAAAMSSSSSTTSHSGGAVEHKRLLDRFLAWYFRQSKERWRSKVGSSNHLHLAVQRQHKTKTLVCRILYVLLCTPKEFPKDRRKVVWNANFSMNQMHAKRVPNGPKNSGTERTLTHQMNRGTMLPI